MANWIIVHPKFDDVTQYSDGWAQEIVDILKDKGLLVADLGGREVTRAEVEEALDEHPEAYVGFWNHGNEDCLWGSKAEKVFDLQNSDRLAGKEVFTMACLSAKELGKEVWSKGGTYWGYTEAFSFTTDSLVEFQEAANCGFHYRFLEGDTHQNALKRAKDTFTELSYKLVDAGKTFAAIAMRNDRDALVYYNASKPGEEKPGGCLLALLKLPLKLK
jgi:hypothetical protein